MLIASSSLSPHTCKGCLYAEDLKVFIEEYKR